MGADKGISLIVAESEQPKERPSILKTFFERQAGRLSGHSFAAGVYVVATKIFWWCGSVILDSIRAINNRELQRRDAQCR